jgi:hypothetical protein
MHKCELCKLILKDEDLIEGKCPECKTKPVSMCKNDRGSCSHPGEEQFGIIAYCPECKAPCCPICGSHDVLIVSRITGYYSDVGGWNAAKAQELKDRSRYDVLKEEIKYK